MYRHGDCAVNQSSPLTLGKTVIFTKMSYSFKEKSVQANVSCLLLHYCSFTFSNVLLLLLWQNCKGLILLLSCVTQFPLFVLLRCVETEYEEAVTPCSLALLRVQMGKALRRMTQNGAQLLLVSTRKSTLTVCSKRKIQHTTSCTPTIYIILLW